MGLRQKYHGVEAKISWVELRIYLDTQEDEKSAKFIIGAWDILGPEVEVAIIQISL